MMDSSIMYKIEELIAKNYENNKKLDFIVDEINKLRAIQFSLQEEIEEGKNLYHI